MVETANSLKGKAGESIPSKQKTGKDMNRASLTVVNSKGGGKLSACPDKMPNGDPSSLMLWGVDEEVRDEE